MKLKFDKPDVVILSTQRSGTHFLSSALASHPRVHNRHECVVFLMRRDKFWKKSRSRTFWQQFLFKALVYYLASTKYREDFINNPRCVNIATVMYSQLDYFEELCGDIMSFKTIHLLRNPRAAALSFAQLKANREQFGRKYPAHLTMDQEPLPQAMVSVDEVSKLERRMQSWQQQHIEMLRSHPKLLTLHYEDITNGSHVSEINKDIAARILAFCDLDYHRLTTNLRKVGTREINL